MLKYVNCDIRVRSGSLGHFLCAAVQNFASTVEPAEKKAVDVSREPRTLRTRMLQDERSSQRRVHLSSSRLVLRRQQRRAEAGPT